MKWLPLRNASHLADYRCHYCGRREGAATRDHKLPRMCGGAGRGAENIVLCCQMCNSIKNAREYALFVVFFAEFLEEHGDVYRAADPYDGKSIRAMSRKFNKWLNTHRTDPGTREDLPDSRKGVGLGFEERGVGERMVVRWIGRLCRSPT